MKTHKPMTVGRTFCGLRHAVPLVSDGQRPSCRVCQSAMRAERKRHKRIINGARKTGRFIDQRGGKYHAVSWHDFRAPMYVVFEEFPHAARFCVTLKRHGRQPVLSLINRASFDYGIELIQLATMHNGVKA